MALRCDDVFVRTAIDIDEMALAVLRDLATAGKRSSGRVASDLILDAVRRRAAEAPGVRNGIPLLAPKPGAIVTNKLADEIREQARV